MTALLACLALVALVMAITVLGLLILRLLDDPRSAATPARPAPAGDRRHGWCEVCGLELHGPHLHEVTDAAVDDDGILTTGELMGGGTAMTAEFCPDHCPGTCRTPHPPSPSPFRSADPFREGERGAPTRQARTRSAPANKATPTPADHRGPHHRHPVA